MGVPQLTWYSDFIQQKPDITGNMMMPLTDKFLVPVYDNNNNNTNNNNNLTYNACQGNLKSEANSIEETAN